MTGALQEEEVMEAKSGMNLHWEPAADLAGAPGRQFYPG